VQSWYITCTALPQLQADKLGCVMFQFHLSFGPTAANRRHVEWCRARLGDDVAMAVEFRSRAWFEGAAELQDTAARFPVAVK
jgi:uncharacterized protein YecE (DUF72 family)